MSEPALIHLASRKPSGTRCGTAGPAIPLDAAKDTTDPRHFTCGACLRKLRARGPRRHPGYGPDRRGRRAAALASATPVTYGWDASNHDWSRGPMDIAAAVAAGIQWMTHKASEGDHFYADPYLGQWYARAKASGLKLYGAYIVIHPGDQAAQVAWFYQLLDQQCPGWRTDPRFLIVQIDAEKFPYMTAAPSPTEIKACGAALRAGFGRPVVPVVYAPRWLYGDTLTGLGLPLWSSYYVAGPAPFQQLYQGDSAAVWTPYSGITPAIGQYTSTATIGTQTGCDANAYRGSVDGLRALVTGGDTDMLANDPALQAEINTIKAALSALERSVALDPNVDVGAGTGPNPLQRVLGDLQTRLKALDPAALAAAVVAAMPPEHPPVDQSTLERALRSVLGALDGATPPPAA